ncbi:glycoside hydrolase family 47 [Lecanosticta acicola]|uniref:alpha-1,2-Mannosidase n=1 Tax=Lecanosticta acicola TaxID=111012 RepID=A0AAI9EFG6_9PEZI|nr:glycoside hydrolase family 47 [Lecanosticta acicola]
MSTYGLPNGGGDTPDLWQSSGRSRFHHNDPEPAHGISEKMSSMFSGGGRKDSLPMYKDKPYHYPPGKGGLAARLPPWARKRKALVPGLMLLGVVCWWFGILSPLTWLAGTGKSGSILRSPKKTPRGWGLLPERPNIDWEDRADMVRDAFKISFSGYEKYGWGYDEYHPVTHTGKHMVPKGMGWIIVDALDTMMLMNLTTELSHARQWVHSNLTYDQDHDVNTFETTIRMLGGLLSAHYLSTAFPGKYAPVNDGLSDDMYVEKATDLADRLLGAYETASGIPLASVNLHTMQGIPSHTDGGASSTAEATSLQLEMKYLAKLTGETHYWEKAEQVMKAVDDNHVVDGLVPIFIYADKGTFRGENIRLGSRGDSYYEYLIKQYHQTSNQEPVYQEMWNESMAGIKKHLLTYTEPNNFLVLAERPNGLNRDLSAKMDHLVCFMPGTIALAATGGLPLAQAKKQPNWGPQQEEDMEIARELTKTCMGMYRTETGLAPEIAHFNIHEPPKMYNDFGPKDRPQSPVNLRKCTNALCSDVIETTKDDFVFKAADMHNLQRPETVESLFYMWRITGDDQYRRWGWEMFQAFVKWTAVDDGEGFSSISNVMQTPPAMRDNMESFWLAETLKYFFLLFSNDDILPLNDVVFNTEAHPFPRFQMGKLFKTGWERRKAGASTSPPAQENSAAHHDNVQTIEVTQTVQQEVVATITKTTDQAGEAPTPVVTESPALKSGDGGMSVLVA